MNRIAALAFLFAGVLASNDARAEAQCVTPYGSCAAASTQNGAACYCSSPNGTLSGQIRAEGSATPGAGPLPTICCTAAGRIPFANTSTPAGGVCTVPTIRGPVSGQVCY